MKSMPHVDISKEEKIKKRKSDNDDDEKRFPLTNKR